MDLLKTFADQAVIAIENVRLFTELDARNRDLTETLEQQTATGEILRVISSSPTDVQPVFDSIAGSAARLCAAEFAWVFRFDGQLLHFAAHHGLSVAGVEAVRKVYPMAPGRGSAAARSILERPRRPHTGRATRTPTTRTAARAAAMTYRSIVAVPMLRDGLSVGSIAVARSHVGPFPDRQIDLLKTFADQAVIAIENVRLFQELEARTRRPDAVGGASSRRSARSSQAVSSTLDLETVLDERSSAERSSSGSRQRASSTSSTRPRRAFTRGPRTR